MNIRHILLCLFSFIAFQQIVAQTAEEYWIDRQLTEMTLDEKIGQLFMVAAYSNKDAAHQQSIERLIKEQHIGGLIFFKGTPYKQAKQTNRYQSLAKVPLLISIDGEWGLDMRLDSTVRFPRQLILGAIQDNSLVYEMGREVGRHCKRLGIHMNLAPVVDVNNNPNNPVINDRSFGEDKFNVAQKAIEYMRGMKTEGVLACAKHFPGHGDTDKDSHYTLPTIAHDQYRLQDIEMYPFRELANAGVASMMSAHLAVPALDSSRISPKNPESPATPASLSKPMIESWLRGQMGYQGLVMTDALNMKGVADYFAPGDVDLKALMAGNDVLLFPENVPVAVKKIKQAIQNGTLSEYEVEKRVRKILKAKYEAGLSNYQPIDLTNLTNDLNPKSAKVLNRKLYENAITLARNEDFLLPVLNLTDELGNPKRFASISIGGKRRTSNYQQQLTKYARVVNFHINKDASEAEQDRILQQLAGFDHVFVSVHGMSRYASKNYYLNDKVSNFVEMVQELSPMSLVVFGTPYSLKYFNEIKTTVVAYEENSTTQELAAQMVFGALAFKGKLPVTASENFRFGLGESTNEIDRLKYGVPEEVGIDSEILIAGIQPIIDEVLKDKMAPGGQLLIAKNGTVIHEQAFGYHTFNKKRQVSNNDLYDVASITKVAATLPGMMQLYDRGVMNPQTKLSAIYNKAQNTNKAHLQMGDILSHQARLQNWIAFYQDEKYDNTYSTDLTANHCLVADGKCISLQGSEMIIDDILKSDLRTKPGYKYSDLGFIIMCDLLEDFHQTPYDTYVQKEFYQPIGMNNTTYNPLSRFDKSMIVPSEDDTYFRNQTLQGYVHDMAAAMRGGVAGHAGIFTNANDLAKLAEMFLNDGTYGGKRFFNSNTIRVFASQYSTGNRRGLGFDKPAIDPGPSPCGEKTPKSTFGHTGFTGTCMWADPENDLIYIFLSNRTYPTMDNWKLVKSDIRTRIQDVIYDALDTYPNVIAAP